jgi:hypothetical protein
LQEARSQLEELRKENEALKKGELVPPTNETHYSSESQSADTEYARYDIELMEK